MMQSLDDPDGASLGASVQLRPTWTRWSFWLLVLVLVAVVLFGAVGRIDEFAVGAAAIRSDRLAVTATDGDADVLAVVALLPGRYRPLLHPGMTLRFTVTGYADEYRELPIDSIGAIVTAAEGRQLLSPALPDGLGPDESVVAVRARLPSAEFHSDGQRLHYVDGLRAEAHVRVRSQPIFSALLPGLKELLHHGS